MRGANRWGSLVGGFLLILCTGSIYTTQVFSGSLETEFGWAARQVWLAFPIGVFVFALTVIPAGRLQDKFGPSLTAYLGAVLLSLGFFTTSFANSLAWHYFTFGVLIGLGCGFAYITPIPVIAKWFPDKRGLALGILVAAFPASALIGTAAGGLIANFGWRPALQILSGLLLVVSLIGAVLLKNPSEHWTRGRAPDESGQEKRTPTLSEGSSFWQMTGSGRFYKMWLSYCLAATGASMLFGGVASFAGAMEGFSPQHLRFVSNFSPLANVGGRIVSGWLSDVWGRVPVLAITISISVIVLALVPNTTHLGWFTLLLMGEFWCYGALLALFPAWTADAFGTKNLGANYGVVFTAWTVAPILGPTLSGRIARMTGSHSTAFYIAAALSLIALGLVLWAGRSKSRPSA